MIDAEKLTLEEPSDTRAEPGNYNQVVFSQLARVSRLVPEVSKEMRRDRYAIIPLFYALRDLDSKLEPFNREGVKSTVSIKGLPQMNFSGVIDLMDSFMEWHSKQIVVFTRNSPGVIPPRGVRINMNTGEITDAKR